MFLPASRNRMRIHAKQFGNVVIASVDRFQQLGMKPLHGMLRALLLLNSWQKHVLIFYELSDRESEMLRCLALQNLLSYCYICRNKNWIT